MFRTLLFGALCIALAASASLPPTSLLEGTPVSMNTETASSKPKMAFEDIHFPIPRVPEDPQTTTTSVTTSTAAATVVPETSARTTEQPTTVIFETTELPFPENSTPLTTNATEQPLTEGQTTTNEAPTTAIQPLTTTTETDAKTEAVPTTTTVGDTTTVTTLPMTTTTTPASTSSTPEVNPPVAEYLDVLPPISQKDDSGESDSHEYDHDHAHHGENYDGLYKNSFTDDDFWKQFKTEDDHYSDDDWNFLLNENNADDDHDHWWKNIIGHDGSQGEMLVDQPAFAGSLLAPMTAGDQPSQFKDIPQLPLEHDVDDLKPIPIQETKAIIEHIDRDLDTMYFNTKRWLSALGNGDALNARTVNKLNNFDKFMDNVSSRISKQFLTLSPNMPTEPRAVDGSSYDHGEYKK